MHLHLLCWDLGCRRGVLPPRTSRKASWKRRSWVDSADGIFRALSHKGESDCGPSCCVSIEQRTPDSRMEGGRDAAVWIQPGPHGPSRDHHKPTDRPRPNSGGGAFCVCLVSPFHCLLSPHTLSLSGSSVSYLTFIPSASVPASCFWEAMCYGGKSGDSGGHLDLGSVTSTYCVTLGESVHL